MPLPIKKLVFPAHALAETDASTGLSMLAVGTSTARERQALPPRTTPARKTETNTLRDFWRLVRIAGELRQRVVDYARAFAYEAASPHSCCVASWAPSASACSFAQATVGCTRGWARTPVEKPQSVPAMTFSLPTSSA